MHYFHKYLAHKLVFSLPRDVQDLRPSAILRSMQW